MNPKSQPFTMLFVYQFYNTLKLHFNNPKYDFSRYGLNTKIFNQASFESRPDKYKYEKLYMALSQRENPVQVLHYILISAFFKNPKTYIGQIGDNIESYLSMARKRFGYNGNVPYSFKSDIDQIFMALDISPSGSFGDYLTASSVVNGQTSFRIPKIIDMVIVDTIQPETALLLDSIYGYINKTDSFAHSNKMWQSVSQRFKKYRCFMNVSDADYSKIKDYVNRKLEEAQKSAINE